MLKYKEMTSETAFRKCSKKLVLLRISQNSQDNNCATVHFLIKSLKKDTQNIAVLKENQFYRTLPDECFCDLFLVLKLLFQYLTG